MQLIRRKPIAFSMAGILLAMGVFVALTSRTDNASAAEVKSSAGIYSLKVHKFVVGGTDPTLGTRKITVGVSINNVSNDQLLIVPGVQMFVGDASGKLFQITTRYLAVGTILGGPVASKQTLSQDVDFDIPVNVVPRDFACCMARRASSRLVR